MWRGDCKRELAGFQAHDLAKTAFIFAAGCSFRLEGGGRFRIIPPDRLTSDDVAFLRARRDEARPVLQYQADDSHLFTV